MRKVTRPIIVLMGVITLVGLPSMGRAEIVDPFSGRFINHEIWRGGEGQGDTGTENAETSRGIKGGSLEMSLTSFGKTDSDTGNAGNGSTRLRLLNPGGLTQLQADVKIMRAEAQACPANTTPSRPRARIIATFFNDGSSTGPGDETGDVGAIIQMVLDSSSGREISISAFRCLDSLCNTSETTPFSSDGFVRFNSAWRQGQKRTLNLLWDQANKQFVGTLDPGRPTEEVHVISYGVLSDTDAPGFDFKDLRVQTLEASCTAGATKSAVTARFDNFIAQ